MSLVNRLKHHAGLSSIPSTDLDIDDALTVISNSRRRLVIRYAVEEVDNGTATLNDLTDYVARAEYGREEITSKERKRVYVGLYQRHADDLVDVDVLRPVDRDHEYHVGENADPLHALVRVCETVCGGDQ